MNTFGEMWRGEWFEFGGSIWRKRSSRTAEIIISRSHNGRRWAIHQVEHSAWFYFSKGEPVNREKQWFKAMGAFDPKGAA